MEEVTSLSKEEELILAEKMLRLGKVKSLKSKKKTNTIPDYLLEKKINEDKVVVNLHGSVFIGTYCGPSSHELGKYIVRTKSGLLFVPEELLGFVDRQN